MAPEQGWGARPAILEGAAVANRVIGRPNRQIVLLRDLLDYQKQHANGPGADIARIHLSDALEGRRQYMEAFQQLNAVTTPDLLGAKSYLSTLQRKILAERERQRLALQTGGGAAATPDVAAPAGDGGANGNGAAAAGGLAALPALPGGGFGATGGGRRFAQNNGGRGQGAETGAGEAPAEESEKMKRMRLAAEAAQVAKELAKKAEELSTISLAKMLDAADAQRALEAAEKGETPPPRRGARLNDNVAPVTDIMTLRRAAETAAREASEAAGDAKRAAIAAQKASEEAAKLALRVFIVDHDTPKEGEAGAPDPAAATPPATDALATPEKAGETPVTKTETPTR